MSRTSPEYEEPEQEEHDAPPGAELLWMPGFWMKELEFGASFLRANPIF